MERRRRVAALIAVVAVGAVAAAAAQWWQQYEVTAAAEAVDRAALEALSERAKKLREGDLDPKELAALLAAARCEPASALVKDYCRLLVQLSYCVTTLASRDDPAPFARELVALQRAVRAAHPRYTFSAANERHLAEACLHAGDLSGAADAVRRGLAIAANSEPREEAALWVNACRLHCHLGRLEQAQAAVVAARRAAAVAARQGDAPVHLRTLRNAIGIAEADLCLLDERYDDAAHALEDTTPEDPRRVLFAAIVAMMRRARDVAAERTVVAWSAQLRFSPVLRRFAAAKAVHAALRHRDDAAAAARLPTLLALAPIAAGDNDGRSATLAIEVALHGGYPLNAALRDDARAAFAVMLRAWREAPALPGGIGFLHLDDRATLVTNLLRLELALDRERGARAAFAHVLAAHAASSREATALDADGVLGALLEEQHGLLVYVPGSFGSVLLAADRAGISAHPLARSRELRPEVDRWHAAVDEALAGGSRDDLAACGERVADALMPTDLRRRIGGWRRLSICGAGLLQSPPFDLMPIAAGGRAYTLGDEVAIESLANLIDDARRAPVRRDGNVLFAAALLSTARNAQPGRFPPELAEACLVPHRARGPAPTLLLDDVVASSSVLSNLRGARIVHLVGHGVSEPGNEHENAIVFSDDARRGVLRGEHLSDRDLGGVIVVLSACDAGDAPRRRGGDPLAASLAGSFLRAGARCVLVPTTTVRLEHQMRAMAVVHRELAAGTPLAEALLAARRECRDADARLELLLMQVHGRGW